MKKLSVFGFLMILLLSSGCTLPFQAEATATLEPTPTTEISLPPTQTQAPELASATATIEPSPTLTFTPTVHPVETSAAAINVESLNLRAGPGTVFEVIGSYEQAAVLNVIERAPGNEWVKVVMQDEQTGWMVADYLTMEGEVQNLPLATDLSSQIVAGRVIDSAGNPVSGVDVAVYQPLTSGGTLRTDGKSNEEGKFYAYLPSASLGTWYVEIIGIDCESPLVNDNCNFDKHFVFNSFAIIEIPQQSPVVFMYEEASTYISGRVTDANGDPVTIRVFADRQDGAYSYSVSNQNGEFMVPASEGIWTVYAIQYNPVVTGESVTIEVISGEDPQELMLNSPEDE